jgi:hypothetical protein
MFSTYDTFKLPVQIDAESTTWTAVELTVGTPFFALSTHDQRGPVTRHFLLHGSQELLAFARATPLGELRSLHLIFPPSWSPSGHWSSLSMCKVLLQEDPPDGSIPSAVAVTEEGTMYGGYPVRALEGDPGPLMQLALIGSPSAIRRNRRPRVKRPPTEADSSTVR